MPKASKKVKSIDQQTMARQVATRLNMPLTTVMEVIELEQKLTMQHVKSGYKVVKKNYITFSPKRKPGYKMISKLNGKEYNVPDRTIIKARLGQGFRAYVSQKKKSMPEKICRFVDNHEMAEESSSLAQS